MEGALRRGRNWLVSGAAETTASAAGGTQRALVSGLRAVGNRDTCTARAGPGPAPVPCPRPAPGQLRTVQAASCHLLAGEGKKKKLANGISLPFPPGCVSYRASDTLSARAAALVSPPCTCTSTSPGRRSYSMSSG